MMLRIKLYKETYISTVTIAWQRERVTGARKIRSPVSNLKKNDRQQVLTLPKREYNGASWCHVIALERTSVKEYREGALKRVNSPTGGRRFLPFPRK